MKEKFCLEIWDGKRTIYLQWVRVVAVTWNSITTWNAYYLNFFYIVLCTYWKFSTLKPFCQYDGPKGPFQRQILMTTGYCLFTWSFVPLGRATVRWSWTSARFRSIHMLDLYCDTTLTLISWQGVSINFLAQSMGILEMHAILQDMVMGNLLHSIVEMIHAQILTHGPKVVILLSSYSCRPTWWSFRNEFSLSPMNDAPIAMTPRESLEHILVPYGCFVSRCINTWRYTNLR